MVLSGMASVARVVPFLMTVIAVYVLQIPLGSAKLPLVTLFLLRLTPFLLRFTPFLLRLHLRSTVFRPVTGLLASSAI